MISSSNVQWRWATSVPSPKPSKPYYITTPIFYVNAAPHVGHMYSMVLADVLKRWQVLQGRKALLCTGTDEHGMKVQKAAAAAGVPPKQLCDTLAATFQDLANKCNVDYDFFIRTTDADHVAAVEHFWFELKRNDFIYESIHKGWYCVSDECFYPESLIEKKMDPMTGRVHMASVETGNTVEWIEEKNYHFRMTALRQRLLEFYATNPGWLVPATRQAEVVNWVTNNLEDLSISRPTERLSWGIPVPDDPSQTIYVWVDALINYITKAGYPNWTPGSESAGGWPADVQVVGKDIVRFHCVYWPALLMALEMPLPQRVLSHGHWTLGRKKMSKSIGNVVNPFFAIDRWGVDPMRFFLMFDGQVKYDSDYSNAAIADRYKKHCQGGLGNLTSRLTRTKKWSVAEVVAGARDLPGVKDDREIHSEHARALEQLPAEVVAAMDDLNPRAALLSIMDVISRTVLQTNKYVADTAPWHVKLETKEAEQEQTRSVYLGVESVRISGIFLQAFIPDKAAEMLDMLGVDPARRTFDDARLGADFTYGVPLQDLGKGKAGLFPPLAVED
ncbi:methionyl-tRNA synthetase [Coniochaeta ligniaria NRRL 30616]|uniref:Probable methionine--tRNA ligase, mitochondrial n=1 Tax=Coniochaeta ligniaria NRRL 30616 TaxID=1408157 RepID=A0A1J7ISD7_9PEZI|nr:methionyl-tRNA synthetase [Coniochaeta ligniaria NRRL 30616]